MDTPADPFENLPNGVDPEFDESGLETLRVLDASLIFFVDLGRDRYRASLGREMDNNQIASIAAEKTIFPLGLTNRPDIGLTKSPTGRFVLD